jgi:hypothetical protein
MEGGAYVERYWIPVNVPVLDSDNRMQFILHRVEDITEFMLLKKQKVEMGFLTKELEERLGVMQ